MSNDERDNWIVNIGSTDSTIRSQLGSAVVDGLFHRYDAHSVEDLNPCDLPDVFSKFIRHRSRSQITANALSKP